MKPDFGSYENLVSLALAEDIGPGDATSLAVIPAETRATATIATRQTCVLAGLAVAEHVFQTLDSRIEIEVHCHDGEQVAAGAAVLTLKGPARVLLTGERTALNFLQRLCGVATVTRQYVEAVAGQCTLLDTRKTTPGWRGLEKYAVRCGGGTNHRMGLYDGMMLKDNHLLLVERDRSDLPALVAAAREQFPSVPIEIEIDRPDQLPEVLAAAPDWVLLDNMGPDDLRTCVQETAGQCRLEASGGITLNTIAAIAASGVDAISIGALTHSAPSVDLGMDFNL